MSQWTTETAEWYARNYGDYPIGRIAVAAIVLASSDVVVAVGCGPGSALRHAASYVTDGILIGVDPVPRMIEIAQEQTRRHPAATRIEFRLGSAEALPLAAASTDVVFAFDSIDHWQDQVRGLAEIRRILRQDGQLIVTKDRSVPGAGKAARQFTASIVQAGFLVTRQRTITESDVVFSLWECSLASASPPEPAQ